MVFYSTREIKRRLKSIEIDDISKPGTKKIVGFNGTIFSDLEVQGKIKQSENVVKYHTIPQGPRGNDMRIYLEEEVAEIVRVYVDYIKERDKRAAERAAETSQ